MNPIDVRREPQPGAEPGPPITPEFWLEVHAEAKCPVCQRRLQIRRHLSFTAMDAEMLGGMTISLARREISDELRANMVKRGWTDVCGICREKRVDNEANTVRT